ncbi:MAG: hypothetical protein LBC63_04310, partial [Holophagales bacterium]|nr:hypothetical protein [Holophagales bacterium]
TLYAKVFEKAGKPSIFKNLRASVPAAFIPSCVRLNATWYNSRSESEAAHGRFSFVCFFCRFFLSGASI